MKTKINIALTLTILLGTILPQIALGNSMIVSSVKDPDLYNNNLSWFRYYQYPGQIIKDTLEVRNIGSEKETVKLYATDADVNLAGSFTPKMENEVQKGLGLWTTLSEKEIELGPNESREINIEIQIPQSIAPGQYFGSIINEEVLEESCNTTNADGKKVNCLGDIQIKTRTGNRIYLTIPGEIKHDISLKNLVWKISSQKKILFTFNITNNGNVAFEPEAIIHIYNSWGQEVDVLQSSLGKSLPGSSTSPMMEWNNKNQFGQFHIKAELFYREDDQGRFDSLRGTVLTENYELGIFIFPWTLALITLVLLCTMLIGYFGRKQYYQKLKAQAVEYTVLEGETIISIARDHHKKWQTIAKLNSLHAPYVLQPNQKIKIPFSQQNQNEK